MAQNYKGATNIGSVRMSYMYGICFAPFIFSKKRLSKILSSNPFPKKRSDLDLSVDFMDS